MIEGRRWRTFDSFEALGGSWGRKESGLIHVVMTDGLNDGRFFLN